MAFIADATRRGLAFELGCRSEVTLMRQLLNVPAGEARARVRAAENLMPRTIVTGQAVEAKYPATAAAVQSLKITVRAANVITSMLDKLPVDQLAEGAEAAVEQVVLSFARTHDAELLARHATALLDRLDQDGTKDDHDRERARRCLDLRRRPNGSGELSGRLEPRGWRRSCTPPWTRWRHRGRPTVADGTRGRRGSGATTPSRR